MAGAITMVATSKSGLGHIRRLTEIARAMRDKPHCPPLELVSNAPIAGIDHHDQNLFQEIHEVPRDSMADHLMGRAPRLVVVDTARVPRLEKVEAPLALVLRETVDDKLERFRLSNRQWSKVIVPNPVDHWCPSVTTINAVSVQCVGWIFRPIQGAVSRNGVPRNGVPRNGVPQNRGLTGPRILIASGGGGSPLWQKMKPRLERLLISLRAKLSQKIIIDQALGPRASSITRLNSVNRYFEPGACLHTHFPAYDLVLTTAGYNSVLEIATCDVPTLLLPLPTNYDDQAARAEYWAPRIGKNFAQTTDQALLAWMAGVLISKRRRPVARLDSTGPETAANAMLALLS